MSNEKLDLNVEPRTPGKHWSRTLRAQRRIPAVVYGKAVESMHFSIAENDAVRYASRQFENTIFVLKSSDKKMNGVQVLRKDIDYHKINRRPIHVDFFAVDVTATVRVSLEVQYEGKAAGVKDGGIFNALRRDVEVECLPTEIPEPFVLDVSAMNVGDVFHVSDLKIPDGVKLITSEGDSLCAVTEPKDEEPATPVAAAEGEAAEGEAAAEGGEAKSGESAAAENSDKKE